MMNALSRIAGRYKRLVGANIADKTLYAGYRILYKLLLWRGVLGRHDVKDGCKWPSAIRSASPHNTYKRLVCVTGFGHSGSGALLDLLSEYGNVTAAGYADPDGSLRGNTETSVEFDLARQFGGLFSIEDALKNGRIFDRDATMKVFLSLVARFYKPESFIFGEQFLVATREFLDSIVDYRLDSQYGYEYCPHLYGVGSEGMKLLYGDGASNCIFHLRNLREDEYRRIANQYIKNILCLIPSKEILALDQPLSDTTADVRKYREYFGDCKLIAVYRDPRDVFSTALKLNVKWIPHDANEFVRWYRDFNNIGVYLKIEHSDFLLVRFEDLVLNYEPSIKRIEDFIGIHPGGHIRPRSAFDPMVSVKNVGLWRTECPQPARDIIEAELKEFCYEA